MTDALFPLTFAVDEFRLLTAIVLGFLFGFSLERAGFGNARKLAAQFYFRDMTVFKVMFTAILVAMVGLYSLVNLGFVDLSMMWINPTFMWAQVVGGFLLGVGFILSGLCPGTSVVSAASGRWDGLVTFAGIFLGTGLFMLAMDLVPGLEALYTSGSMGVSLLPELLGVPPVLFALGVVLMALAAFVGAEKVEEHFEGKHGRIELTPEPRPRAKLILGGALAFTALLALGLTVPRSGPQPVQMASLAPLSLAEAIIGKDPSLMVLDLRGGDAETRIPGAYPVPGPEEATELLTSAPEGTTVVVYDERGNLVEAPPAWPKRLRYRYVKGGFTGWEENVLTPWPVEGGLDERARAALQNQIAGYFTGAAVESSASAPPPPPMPAGGAKKKKKPGGGC